MKKRNIIIQLMFVFVFQQAIQAKSYMPSLERLRNKVDNVMKSSGVTSLKKILKRAKLQGFNPGQGGTTVLSAQGVVGKDDTDPACKLQKIQAKAQEMEWASNTSLITQLQALTADKQKHELASFVLGKIAGSQLPLIDFIIQLDAERDWLEKAKPECTKLLLTRSSQGAKKFHEQARETLQKLNKLSHNLEVLMKIVNNLIVSEA